MEKKLSEKATTEDKGVKTDKPKGQRLDGEGLKNYAIQVSQQNEYLKSQIKGLRDELDAYRRNEFFSTMEWNWKLLNSTSKLISEKFKSDCAQRLMAMMTPRTEKSEEKTDKKE